MEAVKSFVGNWDRQSAARRAGDTYRVAGELLLQFGVLPHLYGYELLCDGIRTRAERTRPVVRTPKDGKLVREGALREAIEVGFLHTDAIHAECFPCADRPSNSEFICTLAMLARDRLSAADR